MKLVALAAALLLVAGCSRSDGSMGNGPVTADGPGHSELCTPMPATEHDATLGLDVLQNTGNRDAVITSISPVDAYNLRIADAVVVPPGGPQFGASAKWPPRSAAYPGLVERWQTRLPAVGYRLAPGSDAWHNLVLHVIKGDGNAGLRAVRIEYAAGKRSYWAMTKVSYSLRTGCQSMNSLSPSNV